MRATPSRLQVSVAVVSLSATAGVHAALLDSETVATTNFHGSQPDQTQIYGPVNSVVGPDVELIEFGVPVWVNGQPLPGAFNIDFSDTNLLITLNADQPFSYFEVLRFEDVNGTIPSFTVTINPATDWNGFNESDIYISSQFDFFQINLTALYGSEGQQISLDLEVPCPADLDASGAVDVQDLLEMLAAWGPNAGHPTDLNGDGSVGVEDLLTLLAGWGSCTD